MTWKVIALTAIAPIPWRNGGGMTRELLAWPSKHDWIWRISVAEVASDGAFSQFEGVQRWLAILSGTGVRLNMDAEMIELRERSAPFAFDGATPVHCTLLDGPVQDLNLMLRLGNSARAGQMRQINGIHRVDTAITKTVAIYSAATAVVLRINGSNFTLSEATLAWQTVPAGAELSIEANDAILMEITLEI